MLVYGAGVIGCYLAHVLCAAGNEVTLLARGAWKDALEKTALSYGTACKGRRRWIVPL